MPVLPDVLADGLRLVVCGSAPGARSAAARQYYAGPGNKFWPTLAAIGVTPRRYAPAEYASLLALGIGLTDIVKDQSGSDASLDFTRADREGLREKILRHRPGVLCFNGKRAAQTFFERRVTYGLQEEPLGATRLFVAPSTSGRAGVFWDPAVWADLAALVHAVEQERGR